MKRNSTELKVYYHGDKDKPVRKKNPNIADIDKQGYSNGSPHRTMSSLIINTPSGGIDMSNTGIPLWANGRILPPYSGIHQFDTTQVKEIPLAKTGGWLQEFQGTEGGSEVFRPQLKPMVDAFNREQQEQKRKLQQSISYQTQPMVAESTDTPSVKMQQEQQILAQERWAENKPVSRTAVTPEKYSNKIAEYSTKEDKEVLDKYYKKYDKATQDEVKAIQAELVANNFLPNAAAIDGKFGDKTKSAYLKYKAKQRVGDLSGETNKSSCSYDGCAEYVSSVTRPYGWVIGDAWEMKNNIESNGGVIKYNIYEDGRFSNVKNVQQLKNVTEQVKKNNKASSDMFQIGDVVGLYNKSSNMHPTALKDGRGTYNTHVGVVTDIKDGKPVISHNIHGKLHHDAFDKLSIGWIGSPASKIGQYKPKKEPNTLDEKINVYSKDLTEILAPGLDNKVLAENIKGILRLETGLGANKPSDSDISRTKVQRFILGEPTDESKISRGIGKLKTAGIPDEIKYFLDIKDDDVSDDAGIKGAIYKYIDAYSRFKKYSEKNPQLHLTQDDIHNMSILAYNQGTGKLMNLGYNNPNMSIDEEVAKLRSLYRGNVKDISSTNYKYLPESMGQVLYNMEYPEGHPTYISRVNKYAITPFEKLMEGTVEPVKGEGVTSLDKKRKGGSKGWLKEFQGVKGSSQVNLVQAALNQANTSFQPTTTAVTKPVISPVPLANQPFPINVKIDDPRKIHPVTRQPINPNRDLKSGNYEGIVIKKIIDEGKKLGFNKNQVLDNIAIALQESGLGQYDDQIGHALYGNPITGMMNDVQVLPDLGDVQLSDIDAGIRHQYLNYKYNTQMINKNPKSDAERLQWYNTPYPKKGQLNTGTEKKYHTETGRSTNRFYGVDVTKAPLKATTLPYGKTIVSLRDSLIAPNADIQKMLIQAGYKKKGGSKLPSHLPEAYRTGGWLKEFQGTEGTSQTGPVATVNLPPVDIVGKKIPWYEKVGKYLQERTPGLMVRDLLHNYARNYYGSQPWEKAPLKGPKAKEFEEGMARDREIKRKQQEDPEGYSVLPWVSPDYWAQNLAMDTRMLGKKLQVFPDYDSELEPWVNPMALVGAMAQPIGQAPAQAQQLYDEGYTIPEAAMPVALSFLNPLVAGRIPMSKAGILPAAELSTVNAGAGVWLDERGKRINQDLQIEKKKGGSKSKGWLNNL